MFSHSYIYQSIKDYQYPFIIYYQTITDKNPIIFFVIQKDTRFNIRTMTAFNQLYHLGNQYLTYNQYPHNRIITNDKIW